MNTYTELEEMRAQLAILNKKLKKEAIVNERLMRSSMKDKAWTLRRKAIVESIITVIGIPYFIWVMPNLLGLSTEFCIFTCFFMILALGYNYYIHSHFRPDEFIHGDLLKAKKDTLMVKKLYANWLKFVGIPFIVVFLCWFANEVSGRLQGEELKNVLGGMGIGIILGGIIGIYQYTKTQRTVDDILRQIEELSNE